MILYTAIQAARTVHATKIASPWLHRHDVGQMVFREMDLTMRVAWESLSLPVELLAESSMESLLENARSYGRTIPGAPSHCDAYEDRRDEWLPMSRPAMMVALIVMGATLLPGCMTQDHDQPTGLMGTLRDALACLLAWIAGTISEMTPGDFFCFLAGLSLACLMGCYFAAEWIFTHGRNTEATRWARSRKEVDSL